jgi:hypothetical protein
MLTAVMACVAATAAMGGGVAFDARRGLLDEVRVVEEGRTNIVKQANLRAMWSMSAQELAAHWGYIDAEVARLCPGMPVEPGRVAVMCGIERRQSLDASMMPHFGGLPRERAVWALRLLLAGDVKSLTMVAQHKNIVKDEAVKLARRKLFSQGKSFVPGKDGRNPLEPLVQPVITALNAPACAGLLEAMESLGMDATNGGVLPPVEAAYRQEAGKLAELTRKTRNEVIAEDAPRAQARLLLLLGVEGYNAFVKQFNAQLAKE